MNPSGDLLFFVLALMVWAIPLGIAFVSVGISDPRRARLMAVALPLAFAGAVLGEALRYYGMMRMPALGFGSSGMGQVLTNGVAGGLIARLANGAVPAGEGVWGWLSHLALSTAMVLIGLTPTIGRRSPLANLALAMLVPGVLLPLVEAWMAEGGWYAQLVQRLGWAWTATGQEIAYLVGASVALSGLVTLRASSQEVKREPMLPTSRLPMLVSLGALAALTGWCVLIVMTETNAATGASAAVAKLFLGVASSVIATLCYAWFVQGAFDPGLTGRGLVAACIVLASGVAGFSAYQVVIIGVATGALLAPILYLTERVMGLPDEGATVGVYWVPAMVGPILGVFVGQDSAPLSGGALWSRVIGVGTCALLSGGLAWLAFALTRSVRRLPQQLRMRVQNRLMQSRQERRVRVRLMEQGLRVGRLQRVTRGWLHIDATQARHLMRRRRLAR